MNHEPYQYTKDQRTPPWSMDDLHVGMLNDLLREHRPWVAMEIGSHRGASTSAFIEHMKDDKTMRLHLVEPKPTAELRRLIEESGHSERITLHTCPVWEIQGGAPACDFVFIDGDHRWPALADLSWALATGTRVIAMHDTRSHEHNINNTWGAYTAAGILRGAWGREWQEDAFRRPGLYTHRGFGWSVAK